MKRVLVTGFIILSCFLLQCTVFQHLKLASIAPNLLIIITSSFGFMRGKKEGLWVGFVCGFLMDIFFGDPIGFFSLVYMLIGYGNGFFKAVFYDEDVKLPIALIASSELLYGLVMYVFQFMMRSRFHFGSYLGNIILPELVYTILITLGLYQIVLKINQKLEAEEKRSASKFV